MSLAGLLKGTWNGRETHTKTNIQGYIDIEGADRDIIECILL